ncbi:hypothetical protein GCM10027019_04520 [Melaminivora jejuensis]|uniref:Rne/Rng family ribonuclease n=1 Tax=Melaminivora jejuensis TaxID=1267217 RepID=UPI001ADEC0FE|nr:Rne/Rng family ribonuclease [Melaminivora jejuensis]UHJ64083.1 Rne/Rng family ribonuclease [Melaminivora jejuensis]
MKRMLINATQAEERRLAIVDGQKLLDYEIEIEGREQRKGNIYKAVVTRVEPSLEACFVDYGEDRHGFLPFKEISKQYFAEGVSPSQARIQDVIREGQELIVQVEKEERGNKGAALTTFVSLAGRYVVLMPNNPRGGGVSRRIEGEDRAELKEAMDQLEYPKGMSIIARTAGIGRTAPELQWDLNYLLKLWNAIDGAARAGRGAFLIYQESSLVIRAIRDYFNSDIGDILIDTDDIYEQAQQFMAHVMPEHAPKVKRYRDDAPLFSRFQIEHQIESAYSRTVILPSGGAIVIDHTEALVSVDVNSARAIKGGDIEETATRTNLEAADEVARQMRLRDLGGLIVIDFIDMEESKNRREVEQRLREALRQDRARVQFGTISKFGLMEMSRQRLKPSLSEGAHIRCPLCDGTGHVRDTEGFALQMLRMIQEECMKDNTAAVHCQVPVEVASFLLNEKRAEIAKIELKQRVSVVLIPNKTLATPHYKLERLKHDDARLEEREASYKLAEQEQEPTHITRRSQEPTNKQTPVIKGVLPDAPAPVAEPRPQSASQPSRSSGGRGGQQPRSAAAAATPVQPPAPAPEQGFFAWLKSLFGFGRSPAPVAAPVAQPAPQPEAPARSEGRRDGRSGGERSRRSRSDASRDGTADTAQGEPRSRRSQGAGGAERSTEGREGRESREGSREGSRNGRGNRAERSESSQGEAGSDSRRAPREGRASRERAERQPVAEGQLEQHASHSPANESEGSAATGQPARGERTARSSERNGERSEERNGERRSRRSDERGPRTIDADAPAAPLQAGGQPETELLAPSAGAARDDEALTAQDGSSASDTGEQPRRERRSRDRYGRDRRAARHAASEANEANEANGSGDVSDASDLATGHGAAQPAREPVALDIDPVAGMAPQGAEQPARRSYFAAAPAPVGPAAAAAQPASPPAAAVPAPQAAASAEALPLPLPLPATPAAEASDSASSSSSSASTGQAAVDERQQDAPAAQPAPAPAPAQHCAQPQEQQEPQMQQPAQGGSALPRVPVFELPVQALSDMASASGLQWVNSDAQKIAAAQAAIAAEPQPVHVPRERPAPVVLDEGPLVLVETRRDLRELRLPFEQEQQQAQAPGATTA